MPDNSNLSPKKNVIQINVRLALLGHIETKLMVEIAWMSGRVLAYNINHWGSDNLSLEFTDQLNGL